MDSETLPAGYLEAGAEYRAALQALGLNPDGLLWAFDKTIKEFVLILITSYLDRFGPLEIYTLLTRAYNASATPEAISPFIIRLHSPKQEAAEGLRGFGRLEASWTPGQHPMPSGDARENMVVNIGDVTFRLSWVYGFAEQKLAPIEQGRRWKRFKNRVEALPVAA